MGWLIALGLLVLLAFLPVGLRAHYDPVGGLRWKWIVGPVRLDPDRVRSRKKQKSILPVSLPSVKQNDAQDIELLWREFCDMLRDQYGFWGGLRRRIRVRKLQLKLILAGEDPCDLAISYGWANAAVANLWPWLEAWLVIKKRDVQILCDFDATQTQFYANAKLTLPLCRFFGLLVSYAVRLSKEDPQVQNIRKGGASQ